MGDGPLDKAAFLADHAMTERAKFPRSEHTVDIALFTIRSGVMSLLLVRRGEHPEKGKWALPGGFVNLGNGEYGQGEDLDDAASRKLAEENGLEVFPGYLEQLKTYGSPWRDRRGRVFSTAYVGMMSELPTPRRGGDAADTHFFAAGDLKSADGPELAFDHLEIAQDALERVRGKMEYEGRLAASFLTQPFTIPELRRVYEAVWGGAVHRGDFRRKVLSVADFLAPTGDVDTGTGGPPADLYRLGGNTQFHPPMLRDSMLLAKRAGDA